jgi:hypothetical protein
MDDKKLQHQIMVSGFIKNKLQEFEYFLKKIIQISDLVHFNFLNGINPVNTSDEDENFTFNAFINTFQSLKDSLEIALDTKIPWSRFSSVRYADFLKDCRNAITHDGAQIINAYVDGKYYMAYNIERIDKWNKSVVLKAPNEDIKTICISFSLDLMKEIKIILIENGEKMPSSNPPRTEDIFKFLSDNPIVPEFVKAMIQQNSNEIFKALSAVKLNPLEEIDKQIDKIVEICNQ